MTSAMRHVSPEPCLRYIRDLYAPEDAVLRSIREQLEALHMCIQIGAEEGKFLQTLIHLHQPRSIVEIGTLGGYSAIWMARALPETGHLYTIEKETAHAAIARSAFARAGLQQRITLLEGTAQEQLPTLSARAPFDMVFIDADKISYLEYLDWSEKHLRKGGLLVADNTLLFDTVYLDNIPDNADIRPTTHQALKNFNQRLANPMRFHSAMLPTKEGLTLALKL